MVLFDFFPSSRSCQKQKKRRETCGPAVTIPAAVHPLNLFRVRNLGTLILRHRLPDHAQRLHPNLVVLVCPLLRYRRVALHSRYFLFPIRSCWPGRHAQCVIVNFQKIPTLYILDPRHVFENPATEIFDYLSRSITILSTIDRPFVGLDLTDPGP